MKFVLAVVSLMFLGLVAAQEHPNADVINDMIKRGERLLNESREIAHALREQHKGHLLGAIEHEEVILEALVVDMKEQLKHVTPQNIHHIHILEEDLLHLENRISEELHIIINEIHPNPPKPLTPAELIARGEKLVKDAQDELKVLGTHHREYKAIEHEVKEVENLIKNVKADPSKANQEAVEKLTRHERTLATLLQRAKGRGH